MPTLNHRFIQQIIQKYPDNYPYFIETGTYNGDTVLNMENYFEEIHTIEVKEATWKRTKGRYERTNKNKIKFHLGDSGKVLKRVVLLLKGNAIFFLDGHYSSGSTGKGEKDCPLYEELQQIRDYFEGKGIIIIDDCRLFGKGPQFKRNSNMYALEDFSHINENQLIKTLDNRVNNFYYMPSSLDKKDRLIINIKSK